MRTFAAGCNDCNPHWPWQKTNNIRHLTQTDEKKTINKLHTIQREGNKQEQELHFSNLCRQKRNKQNKNRNKQTNKPFTEYTDNSYNPMRGNEETKQKTRLYTTRWEENKQARRTGVTLLQLWRKPLHAEAGPSLAKDKRAYDTSHNPMRRKHGNTQAKKRRFARSDEEGTGKQTLKNESHTFPTFAPPEAEAERIATPFAPFAPFAPASAADSAETAGEATAEATAETAA